MIKPPASLSAGLVVVWVRLYDWQVSLPGFTDHVSHKRELDLIYLYVLFCFFSFSQLHNNLNIHGL